MSSVTNTFMCSLPLCTMNVCPTNSGTIVQARAQVLIGSLCAELVQLLDLGEQLRVDERAFLQRPSHACDLACVFPMLVPVQRQTCPIKRFALRRLPNLQLTIPTRTTATHDRRVRRLATLAGAAALGQLAFADSPDDDHPWCDLHHHRADGRSGSSPCRGRAAESPSSDYGRPCRSRSLMWSELPMAPIVARQAAGTRRISPLGKLICAQSASRAAERRAARRPNDTARRRDPAAVRCCGSSCPAECSSAAGNCRPTAVHRRRSSLRAPFRPSRSRECIAFHHRHNATRRCGHCGSDRTGSNATLAGTPSLLRRKSISR